MARQVIPAEAVEALAHILAQDALDDAEMDGHGWDAKTDGIEPFMPLARERAQTYLEAAAPHMLAPLLTLADERDKVHGSIRSHITTYELRNLLGVEK